MPETRLLALFALTWGFGSAHGAELGDIDGDGRLSLRDIGCGDSTPNAPSEWPCFTGQGGRGSVGFKAAIYFESLRRNTQSTIANWVWAWPDARSQEPLAPDPRVVVELKPLEAPGGDKSEAEITLKLTTSVELKNLSIVLDVEGSVLRPRHQDPGQPSRPGNWFTMGGGPFVHTQNPIPVFALPATYLITHGMYVVNSYNCRFSVPPGEHMFRVTADLPRYTKAGSYAVRVHEASECVSTGGDLLAPTIMETVTNLVVKKDVMTGSPDGVPPIVADTQTKQVQGKVEFRIDGAEGYPGDTVTVRVQMRTDVPLNRYYVNILWPRGTLQCGEAVALHRRPAGDEPEPYQTYRFFCFDGSVLTPPYFDFAAVLSGGPPLLAPEFDLRRPLEYFQPLDEWVDLAEVSYTISPALPGGTSIPVRFLPDSEDGVGKPGLAHPRAEFTPYTRDLCPPNSGEMGINWSYNISYEDAFVRVLGEGPGEPIPPEELGVQFILGDVTARPGEVVEVPVFAAASQPLGALRLAIESDLDLAIEAMDVEFIDRRDLSVFRRVIQRGEFFLHERCEDLPDPGARCTYSTPFLALLYADVEPQRTLIDWILQGFGFIDAGWLTEELREVAKLHVRVSETAQPGTARLRPGKFVWKRDQAEVSSGGFVSTLGYRFGPAEIVEGGVVTITQAPRLLRGDSNGDGRVDLSDAVATLGHLFLGVESVSCLEAADADDSGNVLITDAILVLGVLFLGDGFLPPPFPNCGTEAGLTRLECQKGCP